MTFVSLIVKFLGEGMGGEGGGGVGMKNQYKKGELPKNGNLGQFADLRGLGKKEESWVVFLRGVDTQMHTMPTPYPFNN